jgi:electron transfer flavoprotein beta subunit
MRIAVCIKQVPDTETKVRLKADNSGIQADGIKWIISPYDEHAIEESLKIKQSNAGTEVFVFTVGPKSRAGEALRTSLAMGADEGVLVDAPENLDSFGTAKALAAALQKEGGFDLVLTGKLAIDDNASAVSQMLAEFLKIPHITVVSKLQFEGKMLTAEREVEGGTRETFQITLPALVGANKGLNVPRYASLPGIMKAKKKILREHTAEGFGVTTENNKVTYTDYMLPPDKPAVKILSGDLKSQAKELARLLREEAKVL